LRSILTPIQDALEVGDADAAGRPRGKPIAASKLRAYAEVKPGAHGCNAVELESSYDIRLNVGHLECVR